MSTMSGGSGSPEFEKLIQLATFVQGPGYLDRVRELQELERSSKESLDKANAVIADAKVAQDALDRRAAVVKQQELELASAQRKHERKVAALREGLRKAQSDE